MSTESMEPTRNPRVIRGGRRTSATPIVERARPTEAAPIHTHRLKTHPPHFGDIVAGRKRFELRINDRDYRVGDILELAEWVPGTNGKPGATTGQTVRVRVTHLLNGGQFGIDRDHVCMSIARVAAE